MSLRRQSPQAPLRPHRHLIPEAGTAELGHDQAAIGDENDFPALDIPEDSTEVSLELSNADASHAGNVVSCDYKRNRDSPLTIALLERLVSRRPPDLA